MKKILVAVCAIGMVLAMGACKKKEPVPQTVPGQQMPSGQPMPPGMPPGHGMVPGQPGVPPMQGAPGQGAPNIVVPKGEMKVVVPESVKGKWKAVVLTVEDKQTKKSNDYTVNLNSDFKVPGSDLKITVGDFLPDFRMSGLDITSASNEVQNPAVGVRIYEGSKLLFPAAGKKWGWLYGRPEFRTMHPFENPKYAVVLKNAIKKG